VKINSLCVICLGALSLACGPAEAVSIGESLPDMRLNFLGPEPVNAGKPVLLEFWATWCSPCRESIPRLNELHAKYKDRGLVIIGVTEESAGVIRKFQRATPMDYAVATDSGGKLNRKMGVDGIPHAFLADASGKVVWAGHPTSLREEQIEEVLGRGLPTSAETTTEVGGSDEATAVTDSLRSGRPKNTLPSARETSPAAEVLQAEDAASLQSSAGLEVAVEGVVKNVGQDASGGITFLNFGDRKSGLVAVVFRMSYDKFPEGFDQYVNQRVLVRGTLENYKGRQLQIRISTPDQLEIVTSQP
jgi:thiol-disulfide isomerase/thioredoxin